jgi:hypothetical protein
MRTFSIRAGLVLAAVFAATPAAAQYGQRPNYGYGDLRGGGIEAELAQIEERIHIAAERHMIARGEAERLFRDADHIQDRLRHKARDGLSPRERDDLQRRVNALRDRLHFERWGDRRRDW